MKKYFCVFTVIILLFCFSSCSIFLPLGEVFRAVRGAVDLAKEYENMSVKELARLSDEEFCEAVKVRAESKFYKNGGDSSAFSSMKEEEKLLLTLSMFEEEFENGGLSQYYFNSSNVTASYLSDSLGMIGADKHKKVYDDFVGLNKINYTFLPAIASTYSDNYEKFFSLYPFEEFDVQFSALPDFVTMFDAFLLNNKEMFIF